MPLKENQSAFSGIMITAGCTIGAGMFSLPVVGSGMWLGYSLCCLVFIWFLNYLSALYILEANVQFEPGESFNTITAKILDTVMGLSIAFLLYILLYAYYSAFGNMVSKTLGWEIFKTYSWLQGAASVVLGSFLAFIVWLSTAAVGRISSILVIAMIISFILAMWGYAIQIETTNLLNYSQSTANYFSYIWAALPYFITAFGFVTIVPSLYKFYGKKFRTIQQSLLGGSLLALLVYCFFLLVSFGNISRQTFIAVNEAGGNIGNLVQAFDKNTTQSASSMVLHLFSNLAIISSFLGVGLGLFDYIADKFAFNNNSAGRFKTACIAFLPPGLASFFFPNGFIAAIGFAGLVIIFAFFVIPFLMIKKVRKNNSKSIYRVGGGSGLLYFFLISSMLVGVCKILTLLHVLPKW